MTEYVGGYDDWHKQTDSAPALTFAKPASKPQTVAMADTKSALRKLSYNEKRELEALPKQIETFEVEQHELNKKMESPEFYMQDATLITQAVNRLQELHDELARLYQRWGELES